MYRSLMVPVDLSHVGEQEKALTVTRDLAKLYGAKVTYVGVTSNVPGPEAHNPREFAAKLEAFASEEGATHGQPTASEVRTSHDPAVELDRLLADAAKELKPDLIVMATHVPGLFEAVHSHHGSHLATHTDASVLLVRK